MHPTIKLMLKKYPSGVFPYKEFIQAFESNGQKFINFFRDNDNALMVKYKNDCYLSPMAKEFFTGKTFNKITVKP